MATGVYRITHTPTGRCYIGSSQSVAERWSAHRGYLRRGTHHSPFLQALWNRDGESVFVCDVIEECEQSDLLVREQAWIDQLQPRLNVKRVVEIESETRKGERRRALRARADAITHCPRSHVYDAENTLISKKGKRICRACARDWANERLQTEDPEARESRRAKMKVYYQRTREERLAKVKAYNEKHKERKRDYDRARRMRLAG